ncbi:MAG: hypothetical protein JNJ61_07075 [Anaerolineae bacterium]|nr:hypothetical protein [Anaerolineae bacterium]
MLERPRWSTIGFIGLLFVTISIAVLLILPLVEPTSSIIHFLGSTSTPIQLTPIEYASSDVEQLCNRFRLEASDPFCQNDGVKDYRDLNEMLIRKFPPGRSTYSDVVKYMGDLPSTSINCVDSGQNYPREVNYCPPPDQCTNQKTVWYSCTFTFPGAIRDLQFHFQFDFPSGVITG